jgi:hypothetical protein
MFPSRLLKRSSAANSPASGRELKEGSQLYRRVRKVSDKQNGFSTLLESAL